MKKENPVSFLWSAAMLTAFAMWTVLVCFVDVKAIGPKASAVGFATINTFFHNLTGVHMPLYNITDWLGLVPILFAIGFALLGLAQWIKRRSLLKVDYSLLALGAFYVAVAAAFSLFESFVINYRPILINGYLESSYPSSTTLLIICVMTTAVMQFNLRIKNYVLRKCIAAAIATFTIFMVIGRLISGVHWFTDIVGGILLSAGLAMLYRSVIDFKKF